MKKLKGVIFDLDGTVVNSPLNFEAIRKEMGLLPGQPILKTLASLTDDARLARCRAILDRHEGESAENATLMPGIDLLIVKLVELEISHGIFTLNGKKPTQHLLNRLNLTSFSQIVTRDDAPIKPDPAGLLKICSGWGFSTEEVIFVGNYLYDIQAGKAAGIRTILYAQDPLPPYARDADQVVSDFSLWASSFY